MEGQSHQFPGAGAVVEMAVPLSGSRVRFVLPSDAEMLALHRRLARLAPDDYAGAAELAHDLIRPIAAPGCVAALEPAEAEYLAGLAYELFDLEASRKGDHFVVKAQTPLAGEVLHVLASPRLPQLRAYQRRLGESASLYESLRDLYHSLVAADATEGYAGEPPVLHKCAVAQAVVSQCLEEMAREQRSGFFVQPTCSTEGPAAA